MTSAPPRKRQSPKLEQLLELIEAGAGEQGIYALAAAAKRPYRRVHDQIRRLTASGLGRVEETRHGPRIRLRVTPIAKTGQPVLEFNRSWSRPSGGVDAGVIIAQVLARPTFRDLLTCVKHYGYARVRHVYRTLIDELQLEPGAAAESGRMLDNIEIGRARASGID